ncbi:uncharacterized protein LOC127838335 [Dreissena polymorpha]|uniref:Uncharacterized protein n=1 Tax=Dreissena polymorpha TaxID=45954 RepID=A0A9D4FIB5_DREPO|nr:uncharacterized protein LOC127838335 [Dreissena polymorpha]KAH3797040.1 hypothetical protein DPMN_150615 [Dreissena polymorpha]
MSDDKLDSIMSETQSTAMSVSDMDVSWSANGSSVGDPSRESNSAFITEQKAQPSSARRSKCVSAKNSGMRFQGWREPKPLRPRCYSALVTNSDTATTELKVSPRRSAGRAPLSASSSKPVKSASSSSGRLGQSHGVTDCGKAESKTLLRLSQPTASSAWKTSRAREALVDMNYYSWSKMNVYKDYMGVMYGANGTTKRTSRK